MRIAVAGAGGFIGGHLVRALLDQGHDVRAADIKAPEGWWQIHGDATNLFRHDLRNPLHAANLTHDVQWCYDLAEHMGGISFIEANKVDCAESIEIGIALLHAATAAGVTRFFFASSACVYPTHIQKREGNLHSLQIVHDLKEEDAWPALPEEGYGFSKLYMEELCRHYADTYGLEVRIARYHNVYGSPGSWNDGKEKSPAALCRKVAEAAHHFQPAVEVWGNGRQIRSYLHVADCVRGTIALMESDYAFPMNIGSDRAVTINQLLSIIESEAMVLLDRTYNMAGAQGVDGRNADITLAKNVLDWEPEISLEDGIALLYDWINQQVIKGAFSGAASGADSGPQQPTTVGL